MELMTIRKIWRRAGKRTERIDEIIEKVKTGSFYEDPRKLGRLIGFKLEDYDAYRNRPRKSGPIKSGRHKGLPLKIRRKWPMTIEPYNVTPVELKNHKSSLRRAEDRQRQRNVREEKAKLRAEELRLEDEQRRSDEEFHRTIRDTLTPRSAAIFDLLSTNLPRSVSEITDAIAQHPAFVKADSTPLRGESLKVIVHREIDKMERAGAVAVENTTVRGRVVDGRLTRKGGLS
jgi:hypothetical protein